MFHGFCSGHWATSQGSVGYTETTRSSRPWRQFISLSKKSKSRRRASPEPSSSRLPAPPFLLDPDEALAKIRAFLDANGFDDIEIRKLSGYPASQTSVKAPPVQAALSVFRKYAEDVAVKPRIAGSAPFYQFTERLGLPLVFAGFGHGTGAHAPNEYMVITPAEGTGIAGLREIERAYVDLLFALASQRPITE